jgi:hypothetical protein
LHGMQTGVEGARIPDGMRALTGAMVLKEREQSKISDCPGGPAAVA